MEYQLISILDKVLIFVQTSTREDAIFCICVVAIIDQSAQRRSF